MQISSYILVSVTVNRFTMTYSRTIFCKKKTISNINNRKEDSYKSVFIIVVIICIFVSLINLYMLFAYNLINNDHKPHQKVDDCSIDPYEYFYQFRIYIYPKIHLYLFIVLPCIILFILNIFIIKKIMQLSSPSLQASASIHETHKKEKKKTRLSIMLVSVCLW